MKTLIDIIKRSKPHHSYLVITDYLNKDIITEKLSNELDAFKLEIEKSVKNSFKNFLDTFNVKYAKSSSTLVLADLIAKYAKENKKHIIIHVKEPLNVRDLKSLQTSLVAIYNKLTQEPPVSFVYYPLLMADEFFYKELLKNERMWRYKPYTPELDFNVNVSLWISDYKCWSCKNSINVLIGLKIENKVFPLTDFNENLLLILKEYFQDELKRISLKKGRSFSGNIVNYCPVCKAKIGNFYVFDDLYVEQMPFNFNDVIFSNVKQIPYKEIKTAMENTI